MDEFGITDGVDVNLEKRIPVAAGMAGGSTDAASMLYGMNRIFDLGLSRRQLMERGVQIGADVPYCIMRGTALAQGIGEKLSQLPPMVKCPVLIAKPSVSVSTKFVYQNLKLDENTNHPDIDGLIAEIKEKMMEAGAAHARMSGSGPTVFGLFEDEETAQRARDVMKASGLARQVYLTSIYNNRRK